MQSTTFRENYPIGHEQIDAWTLTLNDVFGAFTSSTSTLQYVLTDLEAEFFDAAVSETFAGARKVVLAQADTLETQRRAIIAQDLLDSIEDRADDEDLARRLTSIDAGQRGIEAAVQGYLVDMLRFSIFRGDDYVRFGVSKSKPPLLTEACVRDIGTRVLEQKYTADRITAATGLGFLRWGEPLINAFAKMAEIDDRGKAFAVEVRWPTREPDREPWLAFCFDLKLEPQPTGADALDISNAFARAVQARTELFLPATVERGLVACRAGRV